MGFLKMLSMFAINKIANTPHRRRGCTDPNGGQDGQQTPGSRRTAVAVVETSENESLMLLFLS
jgi:hypothetical protein